MCCPYVGIHPAGENIYLIESSVASAPQADVFECILLHYHFHLIPSKEIFAVMLYSDWKFMNFLMAAYKVFYWTPENYQHICFFTGC